MVYSGKMAIQLIIYYKNRTLENHHRSCIVSFYGDYL